MFEYLKTGQKYDCIIGLSGGIDSSYLAHLCVKEWGLKPLAVTFDNGFGTPIATANIEAMVRGLGLDYETRQLSRLDTIKIVRAFMYAGTPDVDIAFDLAIMRTIYDAMDKHGIGTYLEGPNPATEQPIPLEYTLMDDAYLDAVLKQSGIKVPDLPRLPLEYFLEHLNKKRLRPFEDNIPPDTKIMRELLKKEYGWQPYPVKHGENALTSFLIYDYLPRRFKIFKDKYHNFGNKRTVLPFSSAVVFVEGALKMPFAEYLYISGMPTANRDAYPNNLQYFRDHRIFFADKLKEGAITESFFEKYCQ